MPYLGSQGVIKLRRTPPEPVVLPSASVQKTNGYITVDYDDWFTTEYLSLIHQGGVVQGYAFRDELDRIYFHSTQAGAFSNTTATKVSLASVATTKPVILAANLNATQQSTLSSFLGSLSSVTYETPLRGWPTTNQTYKSQATTNPWNLQGQLRNWELSRSAPEIETGALGEKFSTSIKSTVSGSGTLDFVIDLYSKANTNDVDPLLRLVQLTEQGSTAKARFYLKQTTSAQTCVNNAVTVTPVGAAVYFYATIIFTACSVRIGADELAYGSANFVTTGPIRLLTESV